MRVLKEPMKNPPYAFVSLVLSEQSAHRMILSEQIINKDQNQIPLRASVLLMTVQK